MQTDLRITGRGFGTPDHRGGPMYRHQPRNKPQGKKKTATTTNGNDFLMGRILPIAPDYYIESEEEVKRPLTTKENFDFLYRSALKYAGLMGVELPFRKKKSCPRMNIIGLYKAMDNLLPEHVNLETRDGKLYFCIYRFHDWPDYKLFWIPLDFTEKLPRRLKRITLEFIRRFIHYHGIQDIKETCYYEMAVGYLNDYGIYDEEADPSLIKYYADLTESYEKGGIHRLLKRMKGKSFCTDLEGEIQKYRPGKKNGQKLLELIKEGMEFISSGSPRLMRYCYDWAHEESPDFEPLGLDLQVMLGYSIHDDLCTQMENCFSSDCQETYNITPVTTLYLTPETDRLFTMDKFPEKLSEWLKNFLEHVANNF